MKAKMWLQTIAVLLVSFGFLLLMTFVAHTIVYELYKLACELIRSIPKLL